MNKEEFLNDLQDVLQRDDICNENDLLESYDEWDSLSKMSVMAYYRKNFSINMSLNDFEKFIHVSDLIDFAGDQVKC